MESKLYVEGHEATLFYRTAEGEPKRRIDFISDGTASGYVQVGADRIATEAADPAGTPNEPLRVDSASLDTLPMNFVLHADHIHGKFNKCLKNRYMSPKECRVE